MNYCTPTDSETALRESMTAQALSYVGAGLAVLPLRGKQPVTPHGVKDASCDRDVVRRWWARESWNVGAAVPDGYAVLDVDPRNGGIDTARALTADLGPIPDTLRAITGGDGWHVWVRSGIDSSKVRGKLGPGVDVKKFGGYVVMPPSVHPLTSRGYRWSTNCEVTTLPPAWREALRIPEPVHRSRSRSAIQPDRAAEYVLHLLAEAPDGDRNNELYRGAVWLADLGVLDGVAREVIEIALAIGLDSREISRTIQSAKEKSCRS